MRTLPLYPRWPELPLEQTPGLDVDPKCTRCELHEKATKPLPAEGQPGGLLVVGESPGTHEDAAGRPFVGPSGRLLREVLRAHWTGPVALDNAVRCYPGQRYKTKLDEKHVDTCRPYLAQSAREVGPVRIVALGTWASYAVLGRKMAPLSTRKAWAWAPGYDCPVISVMHPAAALRNRFLLEWFREDMKWALTEDFPRPTFAGVSRCVQTPEDAQQAVAELRAGPWFAWDTETTGRLWDTAFACLSFAGTPKGSEDAWVWDIEALRNPAVLAPLRELLEDSSVRKVAQNGKYDLQVMACAFGIEVIGNHFDTRLVRKLLEPEAAADLKTMAELVGYGGHKEEAQAAEAQATKELRVFLKKGTTPPSLPFEGEEGAVWLKTARHLILSKTSKPRTFNYALVNRDVLSRYNGLDTVSTAALASVLEARLSAEPSIRRVWDEAVGPASDAIAQVERWGMHCDREAVSAFAAYCSLALEGLRGDMRAYGDFNPASVAEVRELLYGTLRLPHNRVTDTGMPSTDEDSLESIKALHPLVPKLMAWKKLAKLKGTYADGLVNDIRADGRIHSSIHVDGARSGRTSSSDPNLHNLPRANSGPDARMARDCFTAPPGTTLIELDFSQLELRVAAMLSGDDVMADIYRSGRDFHMETARMIAKLAWGKNPDDLTEDGPERSAAKIVNFALLYGKSDYGMSEEIGCTEEDARAIRQAVLGKFTKLRDWIQECLAYSKRTGYCWTWWNGGRFRRRPLLAIGDTGMDPESVKSRRNAERSAWNTRIQGTGSDYCLASIVETVRWLKRSGAPAKLVISVHDSQVLEVREDAALDVAREVQRIMCGWPSGNVPLKVDCKKGQAWGSLEKLKLD